MKFNSPMKKEIEKQKEVQAPKADADSPVDWFDLFFSLRASVIDVFWFEEN